MGIVLTPISSSDDLITSDRAARLTQLAALNSSNPTYLASLITAASRQIEKYCHRHFPQTSYQEYFSGPAYPYDALMLKNYPVIEIDRIATCPVSVLLVQNTDNTTNQRATVATSSTGLNLVRVASAVKSTSTLLYSDYPTITQLAGAIAGLGNGWTTQVTNSYGSYPSADLRPLQGAATALQNGAMLELYTEDLPNWGGSFVVCDPAFGWIGDGPGWRLDAESGVLVGQFPAGRQNIRVDYTAGYAEIPDDLQEACAQHVLDLYNGSITNGNLSDVRLGNYRYSIDQVNRHSFSAKVQALLNPYIAHSNLQSNKGA